MDDIGRLIKLAGARDAVPEECFARVREKVEAHWLGVVAEQQRGARTRRPGRLLTMAAGLVLAVGIAVVLWTQVFVTPVIPLATVERFQGEVGIGNIAVTTGMNVHADTLIVTGDQGRVALRLAGGQSLRIDTGSKVSLRSPVHVALDSGAVYIDTAHASRTESMQVSTPLGSARDIGTQFIVRLVTGSLVVGVRQGQVEVTRAENQTHIIDKGYTVELAESGSMRKRPLRSEDPDWAWIETLATGFDIEKVSLEQYLQWYAGERGLQLQWTDKVSQSNARAATLSGSLEGTSLDEGLEIVKRVAPFEHRISDGELWVSVD